MKRTIVVAAFPGCGKTYMFNNRNGEKYTMLDSDSSQFSWIINESGEKERNPDFPANYIEHIKENIGKVDVIFVSTYDTVLDALYNAAIPHFIIKPQLNMKNNFIKRYEERGNDESFIKFISSNWVNFLEALNRRYSVMCRLYSLSEDTPYINTDILDRFFNIKRYMNNNGNIVEAFQFGVDNIPDWFMDKVTSKEADIFQERRIGGKITCDYKRDGISVNVNKGEYIMINIKGELSHLSEDEFKSTYKLI